MSAAGGCAARAGCAIPSAAEAPRPPATGSSSRPVPRREHLRLRRDRKPDRLLGTIRGGERQSSSTPNANLVADQRQHRRRTAPCATATSIASSSITRMSCAGADPRRIVRRTCHARRVSSLAVDGRSVEEEPCRAPRRAINTIGAAALMAAIAGRRRVCVVAGGPRTQRRRRPEQFRQRVAFAAADSIVVQPATVTLRRAICRCCFAWTGGELSGRRRDASTRRWPQLTWRPASASGSTVRPASLAGNKNVRPGTAGRPRVCDQRPDEFGRAMAQRGVGGSRPDHGRSPSGRGAVIDARKPPTAATGR